MLARSKGRTVRELQSVMTISEFAEELAYHLYFDPLPNTWQQASLIATCTLNPHMRKGRTLKPFDFVPIVKDRTLNDTAERDREVADTIISHLQRLKELRDKKRGSSGKPTD